MKYYKNSENKVFAYEEDGSQDALIGDKTSMTAEEVELHINPPKTEEQIEVERKAESARQLEVLTVTTSKGNTFDANNQARLDMQNGIEAAKTTKELIDLGVLPAETEWETTKWRLANNSEVVITLMELKEASLLAIKKYTEVKGIGA